MATHEEQPDQGEGHIIKAIASYVIPGSLRAPCSVLRSLLRDSQ